jgi:hypothetical protein
MGAGGIGVDEGASGAVIDWHPIRSMTMMNIAPRPPNMAP